MFATAHATARYHERYPECHQSVLGRTGLVVSGAGFGGYRIGAGIAAHGAALEAALRSGINLIDTSANYADGGSERLIGETMARLIAEGSITRDQIVLVTKGGYIQGSNYAVARERVEAGSGFLEVVEYADGLWHCISPEFLEDQITRSLARLGMPGIDLYLLHNPEYYLSWAAKHGLPLGEARAEYYRRIRNAFRYLESEVERGRIAWYGISSNSIPHASNAPDFTSLEECVHIAEMLSLLHHFAVVQFPANLIERGFIAETNQSGGRTAMAYAREKNLGVLINRPLNAITENGLVRLSDFPAALEPFNQDDLIAMIASVIDQEKRFTSDILPTLQMEAEALETLVECATIGSVMGEHWQAFGGIEHYNDLIGQVFAPRLGYIARTLGGQHQDPQGEKPAGNPADAWRSEYIGAARELLRTVGVYYARSAQRRSDAIRNDIAGVLGSTPEGSLSSLAIRMLHGVDGVDAVLVGMRREEYVEDVLAALAAGPLGDEEAWKRLEIDVK